MLHPHTADPRKPPPPCTLSPRRRTITRTLTRAGSITAARFSFKGRSDSLMRSLRRGRMGRMGSLGISTAGSGSIGDGVPAASAELGRAADGAIQAVQAEQAAAATAGSAPASERRLRTPRSPVAMARDLVRLSSERLQRGRARLGRTSSLRPPELPRTVIDVTDGESTDGSLPRSQSASL